jgi:hypothetical protein
MKKIKALHIFTIVVLTAGMLAAAVQDASASPGAGPTDPPKVIPEPPEPPDDGDSGGGSGNTGTPEPPNNGGSQGDSGNSGNATGNSDGKSGGGIITQIIKVFFESSTMKDAIVTALDAIFSEALSQLTNPTSSFYKMGAEVSKIVFDIETLKETRLNSWVQLRKVAFALLPLTAALTIWAAMKDGLYSVTGYANTFEAIAEFFVSIALALASYWLMEQSIGLVKTLSVAIAESLDIEIKRSVFDGFVLKSLDASMNTPVLTMITSIFMFLFVMVFIGSVLISFLAREVVIIIAIALAPVVIILGSVRPLGWLRGLWFKAFLVVLLLLPVNVLALGIGVKFLNTAGEITTGNLASLFQLVIVIGITSVLIAINGTLGKMVYGAAMEVANKIGGAIKDVGAMGAKVAGLAIGGGLGGVAGTAVGGAAAGLGSGGGSGGNSGGLGVSAGSLSDTSAITRTSGLSSTIGSALSASTNPILRSTGQGLREGSAIRDQNIRNAQASPRLPYRSAPYNLAEKSTPGLENGLNDITDQFATEKQRMAIGVPDYDVLEAKARIGVDTAEAALLTVENAGGSMVDYLRETGYIHAGRSNIELASREYFRAEGGAFALDGKSKYTSNDVSGSFPNSQQWHNRDIAVGHRIVQAEQRHQMAEGGILRGTPDLIKRTSLAVASKRLSGASSYDEIMQSAAQSGNLNNWINDILGQ